MTYQWSYLSLLIALLLATLFDQPVFANHDLSDLNQKDLIGTIYGFVPQETIFEHLYSSSEWQSQILDHYAKNSIRQERVDSVRVVECSDPTNFDAIYTSNIIIRPRSGHDLELCLANPDLQQYGRTLEIEINQFFAFAQATQWSLLGEFKGLTALKITNLKQNRPAFDREFFNKLATLSQLTSLSVTGFSLPPSAFKAIQQLRGLTSLDLSRSETGNGEVLLLAETLKKLPQLRKLVLRSYPIFGGPFRVAFDERIDQVLESLAGLSNLEDVDVSGIRMDDAFVVRFAELLLNWPRLKSLNVSAIQFTDTGLVAITNRLVTPNQIRSLDLSGNLFGKKGAVALSEKFSILKNLSHLDLHGSFKFNRCGAADFVRKLPDLTQLQYLNLSNTKIDLEGGAQITNALSKLLDLRVLDLSHNQLVPSADRLLALPKLHTLRLNNSSISDGGAKGLAESLAHLPELRVLDLSRNEIGYDGGAKLMKALSQLAKLEDLNLHHNPMNSVILTSIPLPPALRRLDLSIAEGPLSSIWDTMRFDYTGAISQLSNLETLKLTLNSVQARSQVGQDILKSVGALTQLKVLDLSVPVLSRDLATSLRETLPHLTRLKSLTLRGGGQASYLAGVAPAFGELKELRSLKLKQHLHNKDLDFLSKPLSHLGQLQFLCIYGVGLDFNDWDSLLTTLKGLSNLRILQMRNVRFNDDVTSAIADLVSGIPRLRRLDIRNNWIQHEKRMEIRRKVMEQGGLEFRY